VLQEWLWADGFPRRPRPEFADGRGIKFRIDRQGSAVVLRECVGEPIIRVEEEAGRSHASGVRLNTSKAESCGNERGSGIEISDFVQITTRRVHRRAPHCRGNSVIGRGAVNAGTSGSVQHASRQGAASVPFCSGALSGFVVYGAPEEGHGSEAGRDALDLKLKHDVLPWRHRPPPGGGCHPTRGVAGPGGVVVHAGRWVVFGADLIEPLPVLLWRDAGTLNDEADGDDGLLCSGGSGRLPTWLRIERCAPRTSQAGSIEGGMSAPLSVR
jgi:hypothetical protein